MGEGPMDTYDEICKLAEALQARHPGLRTYPIRLFSGILWRKTSLP
jgi:hypothetical protein